MKAVLRAAPLYTFLWFCNQSALPKSVLDCGAGGPHPLLALFHECGCQTFGLELSEQRARLANQFAAGQGIDLHIQVGDMRCIPLLDAVLSFVYSFNSIFHLRRADIASSIREIRRVLRPGGLYYLNFLSRENEEYGAGQEIEPGTFLQAEQAGETLHTYFDDDEGDGLFEHDLLVRKEKRVIDFWAGGDSHRTSYLDYYVQKQP